MSLRMLFVHMNSLLSKAGFSRGGFHARGLEARKTEVFLETLSTVPQWRQQNCLLWFLR